MYRIIAALAALLISLSSLQPVPSMKVPLAVHAEGQYYQAVDHLVASLNVYDSIINDNSSYLETSSNVNSRNERKSSPIGLAAGFALVASIWRFRLFSFPRIASKQVLVCGKYSPRAP